MNNIALFPSQHMGHYSIKIVQMPQLKMQKVRVINKTYDYF